MSSMFTLSLGVASLVPSQDKSETVLLSIADEALYNAKNSGRNTVSVNWRYQVQNNTSELNFWGLTWCVLLLLQ